MPDIKGFHVEFKNYPIDGDLIKYKDPAREKQRLGNLDNIKAKRAEERLARKEKYEIETARKKEAQKLRSKRKRSRNRDDAAEWEELATEMKLLKKLKAGEITAKQFAHQTGE